MESLLVQLTHSPRMNLIVREAQSIVNAERKKRMKFYNDITEQQKAEFINGTIHSKIIKGFTIPVKAVFKKNEYLKALKTILK